MSWNTDTQETLSMFKDVKLEYIECTDNKECSWVRGYPTWVIGDQEYVGKLTLEQLKDASGC
jgi:2-hydroxychromene-2-carboxylate isomerase